MSAPYNPPVDRLLTFGDVRFNREWPNYLDLGFSEEHIPELIRLATDEDLYWAEDDGPEYWGPLHAWRVLGLLRAEAAIEPLISLFREWEESDWVTEEIPNVLGRIGPKAMPSLARHLEQAGSEYDFPLLNYASSLEAIGQRHPETRNECISILTRQLRRFEAQDATLNGFLISDLVGLEALESLPVIREAFDCDCVDYTVVGDMEEVEILLKLRKERSSPPDWKLIFEGPKENKILEDPNTSSAHLLKPQEKLTTVRQTPKVGRNDPCPCGSGRKNKKCCLGRQA